MCLGALCSQPAYADDLLHQTAIVGGLSAEIDVHPDIQKRGYVVGVMFRDPNGMKGLNCVSAYRVLRFELRDEHGDVVPINKKALENPPYPESDTVGAIAVASHPPSCEPIVTKQAQRVVFLGPLYPNVRSGLYHLKITFAPHTTTQFSEFQPIAIRVEDQDPL